MTSSSSSSIRTGRTARMAAAALLAPAALAALVAPAPAQAAGLGTAYAHSAYGYPYPNAPKCTGGGACVADQWNFYQGQCVSWAAFRLNQVNHVAMNNSYRGVRWGSAYNWANAARSAGVPVDQVAAAGAVAWYGYGHVAYVEKVNSDGSIVISELNYVSANGFDTVTAAPGSGRWPNAFIHFSDLGSRSSGVISAASGYQVVGDQLRRGTTVVASGWGSMRLVTTVSDVTGDGRPDVLAATRDGRLWFYPSAGSRLGNRRVVGRGWDAIGSLTASGNRVVAVSFSGKKLTYRVAANGSLH